LRTEVESPLSPGSAYETDRADIALKARRAGWEKKDRVNKRDHLIPMYKKVFSSLNRSVDADKFASHSPLLFNRRLKGRGNNRRSLFGVE